MVDSNNNRENRKYNIIENEKNKDSILILMVEIILSGIVLGLVSVTILGLLIAGSLQYQRGIQFRA